MSGVTGARHCAEIARQNDLFRKSLGTAPGIEGQIVKTASVHALGPAALLDILQALVRFEAFEPENDPFGDHGFGAFDIEVAEECTRIFWKIDLYDLDYRWGSDAPQDPSRTRRVLTIMTGPDL